MAVRPGIQYIVTALRHMTATEPDEYDIGGVTYWSDEQLQDILDRHSEDVVDRALSASVQIEVGKAVTRRYYLPGGISRFLENDSSVLTLKDTTGRALTGYTYIPNRRLFEFSSNTNRSTILLVGIAYDVNRAAAEVWEIKAAHKAHQVEVKAGPTAAKEQQEYEHYLRMAAYYKGLSGMKSASMSLSGYDL